VAVHLAAQQPCAGLIMESTFTNCKAMAQRLYGKVAAALLVQVRAVQVGGLQVTGSQGVIYNILADRWQLSSDMDVNYMLVAEKA